MTERDLAEDAEPGETVGRMPLLPPPSDQADDSPSAVRAAAREALRGKWGRMALVSLVLALLIGWQINTDNGYYDWDFDSGIRAEGVIHLFAQTGPVTREHEYVFAQVNALEFMMKGHEGPDAADTRAAWKDFVFDDWGFWAVSGALVLAANLLGPMLTLGRFEALDAAFRGELPRVGMLFARARQFGRALWMDILIGLATGLWLIAPLAALMGVMYANAAPTVAWIVLIVAGLGWVVYSTIATYRYAMAPYLLWKYPQMRAREAMRESRLRMRGNKMSLFLVYLSYLGWQILGIAVAFVLSEALASWLVSPLAQPALQWLLTLLAASFLRSYISAGEFAFFRALEQSEDGGE